MMGDERDCNLFISISGIYAKVEIHEWFSISKFLKMNLVSTTS
jgi:hypothetical protein